MKKYKSKNYLIEEIKTKTYSQIAKENNVNLSTIFRNLKKFGLTKKGFKKWNKKELKFLEDNYKYNSSIHKLFPNRTKQSVYHKANKLKMERIIRERKYKSNQNFFKEWSSEMTYVFGLFCSDGYVSSKGNIIGFHINEKDIHILKTIRRYLESSHPIKKDKDGISFRISNKILHDSLIELGCYPNKSVTLKFPLVPNEYLKHFIRGFFDGDGSIHFNKPNTIKISFIAGKSFLETLQNKLKKHLNIRIHPLRKHVKIWIATYYGDEARKICDWMYEDCKDLFLKRKRERFNRHINLRIKNGQTSNIGEKRFEDA